MRLPDLSSPSDMRGVKDSLINMLIKHSFKQTPEPTFRLACGEMSCFYVNCKNTALRRDGMRLGGILMLESLKDIKATAIGGLTFGADSIANATALISSLYEDRRSVDSSFPFLDSFSIRKELKDHGIINWIEGDIPEGSDVVIIDDVCTTGGSTLKAIERARIMKLNVVATRILVDRQEMGGMDNIRKEVSDTKAIITIEDLLGF